MWQRIFRRSQLRRALRVSAVGRAFAASDRALSSHPRGRALKRLYHNLDRHHAVLAASAMAFDAFLSLIPLAAFAGFLVYRVRQGASALVTVVGPIVDAAPRPVQALVNSEFIRLSEMGAAALPPISVLVFVWVTSAGMSTGMGVFEATFSAHERPWYRRRLVAIGLVFASIAAFVAAGGITLLIVSLFHGLGPLVSKVLAMTVPGTILFVLLYAFFHFALPVEDRYRKGRRVIPGVLLTLALWSVISYGFSLYVARLSRYATLYGSLAAVAILLFWLWLLSLALLIGGEVNAELEREAREAARAALGEDDEPLDSQDLP